MCWYPKKIFWMALPASSLDTYRPFPCRRYMQLVLSGLLYVVVSFAILTFLTDRHVCSPENGPQGVAGRYPFTLQDQQFSCKVLNLNVTFFSRVLPAINKAFTELESKGKLRKLWDYGKFMYTAASWGATAVGYVFNPPSCSSSTSP